MLRVPYCRAAVKELTSGVDALHLSARCELPAEIVTRFEAARVVAVETEAPAPVPFGGYDWEIQPHGLGRYHFRLDHPLAIVGVTTSETLPTFRVQTRSEALHSQMGPRGVVRWITSTLHNEGLPAN